MNTDKFILMRLILISLYVSAEYRSYISANSKHCGRVGYAVNGLSVMTGSGAPRRCKIHCVLKVTVCSNRNITNSQTPPHTHTQTKTKQTKQKTPLRPAKF